MDLSSLFILTFLYSLSKLQTRMENLRTEESAIVRLPKGPDGTRGFSQQQHH